MAKTTGSAGKTPATKASEKKAAPKKKDTAKGKVKAVKKDTPKKVKPKVDNTRDKKGRKCCPHCPDYEYCEEKGICCNYCDFCLNGKCTYGKKKGIPSLDEQIELPDYRGDDFGIDDYEAYETIYE